jgi:hypothetical protein
MSPGIAIAPWRSGRLSTMHPTSTVPHRSVAARFPCSPRVGSASGTLVHGQFVHGLVPLISAQHPRQPCQRWLGHLRGRGHVRPSLSAGRRFDTALAFHLVRERPHELVEGVLGAVLLLNGLCMRQSPGECRQMDQGHLCREHGFYTVAGRYTCQD